VLQREECYRSAAALVTLTFLDPLYGHRMLQVQLQISLIVATSTLNCLPVSMSEIGTYGGQAM